MKLTSEIKQIMEQRFGHDTLLSVATVSDDTPYVRIVDSYYEDGAFYTITYSLSNKMKHIKINPTVGICGEWFSGHGKADNLGWVLDDKNSEIMSKLRTAFAKWYDNGHTNESDKNTCVLRITVTDAVICADGKRFEVDFT